MSSVLGEGSDDKIVIYIDSRNGYRAKLAIGRNEKLELLFKKYCNKLDLPVGAMRFIMDGKRVEGKKTVGQLRKEVDESEGLDQDIVIQAMEPLNGGAPGDDEPSEASRKRKAQEMHSGAGGDLRVTFEKENCFNFGVSVSKKVKGFECKMDMKEDGKVSFSWIGQVDEVTGAEEDSEVAIGRIRQQSHPQKVVASASRCAGNDNDDCVFTTFSGKSGRDEVPTSTNAPAVVKLRFYHLGESILMVENAQEKVETVLLKFSRLRNAARHHLRFFAAGERLNPELSVAELKQLLGYPNAEDEIEIDVIGEQVGGGPGADGNGIDGEVPHFVQLTFEMPNRERVPLKFSTEKKLLDACKIICSRKNLNFETSRFKWNGAWVKPGVNVADVWKITAEKGEAEILVSVVDGSLLRENEPTPKEPGQPPEVHTDASDKILEVGPVDRNKSPPKVQNSSDNVKFILKMSGHAPVTIVASRKQRMKAVFRKYSEKMNIDRGNLRFLWDERINDNQRVGSFKEVFDQSDEGKEGEDIEIDVFPVVNGGNLVPTD